MRRKEYFDRIRQRLEAVYPPEEARAMAFALLKHYAGLDRTDVFLYPETEILPAAEIDKALEESTRHRPLQYILGETEFAGLLLKVDERVLIPRPETEELVDRILRDHVGKTPSVLDIGTGSGAIAIALAKGLPGAPVTAVDISPDALAAARENARLSDVEITFCEKDILREEPPGTFDVIVSNPPYVRLSERKRMRSNVLDHEPAVALFVPDDDPLLFYRRITELGRNHLNTGGALYFEINEAFGRETTAMLEQYGYRDIELRKDLFDKDRMVSARWN